jgi:hypothetical protein
MTTYFQQHRQPSINATDLPTYLVSSLTIATSSSFIMLGEREELRGEGGGGGGGCVGGWWILST